MKKSNFADDADLNTIINFLDDLESLLNSFVKNFRALCPYFLKQQEFFIVSWKDTKTSFQNLKNYLLNDSPIDALQKVALRGSPLQMKVKLYYTARYEIDITYSTLRQILELEQKEEDPERQSALTRFANMLIRHSRSIFVWAFKNADVILGSIGSAGLPFVDVIEEFKDSAKNTLEQSASYA